MSELSPTAQAVLDAFRSSHTGQGCLAAALRAAVGQDETLLDGEDECLSPVRAVRTDLLLAIADELEAQ